MSGVPNEEFRPVYATPADWYVAGTGMDWTAHTVGDPLPPAPPPRVPVQLGPPIWRVLPVAKQPALATPISAGHPLLSMVVSPIATQPHPVVQARFATAPSAARPMLAIIDSTTAGHSTAVPMKAAPAPALAGGAQPVIRPLQLTSATAALTASTTVQTVTTDSISMSFEHCIVMLQRPWFPEQLLLLRNWFMPGYARGDISAGKGSGDTGIMPVVTTGFVAIRNLKIASKWSTQDLAAVEGAASFGPFSLIGRSYDQVSGTLASPGMQIIGWFCSALPVLPPASDPTLTAAVSKA